MADEEGKQPPSEQQKQEETPQQEEVTQSQQAEEAEKQDEDSGKEQAKANEEQEQGKSDAGQDEAKPNTEQEETKADPVKEEVESETKPEEVKPDVGQEEVKQDVGQEEIKADADQQEVKTDTEQQEVKAEAGPEEANTDPGQEQPKAEIDQRGTEQVADSSDKKEENPTDQKEAPGEEKPTEGETQAEVSQETSGDTPKTEEAEPKAEETNQVKTEDATEQKNEESDQKKVDESGQEKADEKEQEKVEEKAEVTGQEKIEEAGQQKAEEAGQEKAVESGQQKAEQEQKEATNQEVKEDEKVMQSKQATDVTDGQKDDEEEAVEKKEEEDEVPKIPDDFYYEYEKFQSRPYVTPDSGLPEDMISLQRSFGYDCTKRGNLHLLDERTIMFAAGNMVIIIDLPTKKQTFIRSTSGGGIGAIRVHPSRKYFAVAEKGDTPNINLFEYPSLKLYRILRGGTEKAYSYIDFNPDGTLLASQGAEPDYMLTLWDWKEEKTVLRSKAFSQEVFRVTFSTELEGLLTTSGTVHIKFWKMADTFTGLKLQGELGKFGRTDLTDIEGYVELPDGKVLSGCEWGNMLLWDGGLIKVEIQRKNKKSCHNGPIQQILLDEGELMSIGVDGCIRVWDFEAIDTADSTDESGMFELDPMNELKVGPDVQLKTIIKSVDTENEPTIWYAQDANGGIWKLDLSFSHTSMAPEKLFTHHAGRIVQCDSSPVSELIISAGVDGSVRLFDYVQQKQICDARFPGGGSSLVWAPQIVDPKGGTIYTGFSDGVIRVLGISKLGDDGHKKKHHHECSLELLQALKPHSKDVTSLAVDQRGEILASGSSDGTVFFINIGKTYEPIGFVKVPGPVTKIQWSPVTFEKTYLLVFCEGGIVHEIEFPDDKKFDTSHSYEISGLPSRSFKFRSIKSRLRDTSYPDTMIKQTEFQQNGIGTIKKMEKANLIVEQSLYPIKAHEEELERKAQEEEARKKKEAEERRKRIERGLETESEQGDIEEEEKEPEPEWHPYIPDEASPILTGFYSEPGKFWLSMGDFDAGYLYECQFYTDLVKDRALEDNKEYEPERFIPVHDSDDVPICTIEWSKNGQQALFGMNNGQIRLQTVVRPYDISELGPFWSLNVHDSIYGHITGLMQSYDGQALLSCGSDGNFFYFQVMGQEQLDQKVAENKAKIPSAKRIDDSNPPDDIEDPNAYSIEEAKQKSEYEKMMKEAEEKKREVRRHVAKMRRLFKQLLEQNEQLPKHLRLHKDEFEMDREIKQELDKHKQDKIDLVRKELAWESDKQRIALEKLRKRFKDVVECDRIVVKAFQTAHEVASIRDSKLSEDFYQLKADFERRRTMGVRDDMTRDPTRDILTGTTRITDSTAQVGEKPLDQADQKNVITTLKGSMGERITKALHKVEEKKKKRAERKALWEDLYETKPADDYEDPADRSAIKEAKDNMGDYKLKTAKDYVVPDHLRMNVEKARGRLLVLKDLIHENKYEFNQRLLTLRNKKIKVIEEIKDLVTELEQVQSKLDKEAHKPIPPVPVMHADEMPEKKLEYTRETLIAFKKEMVDKAAADKKKGQQGDGGGFGGFGGLGGGDKKSEARTASPTMTTKQSTTVSTRQTDKGEEVVDGEVELSPMELQMRQEEIIRMLFLQDHLLSRIEDLLSTFDAELRLLRHDKFRLDITMKNADLRQVTLFEELVLLKEYEKREDVLAEKLQNKQQERVDMQAKIIDVQSRLEIKKKDIEKLQEREKALHQQFLTSLGDNNKFADYLTKVFKKKIKRSKKKDTTGDDDDDDSDEDSEDESDWDDEDDDDESEGGGYDLDICPPGCDQNLYEATCQLREKKLDIEEMLAEEKKTNDTNKKDSESFQKKLKVIDNGLKAAQQDLEAFQLEKQQKLNELNVVVSLKLHQIQYMINGILPQDLSNTLVFEANGVTRLQLRIKELEHEKYSQKKHMGESKKKHVQLIKDRKVFEAKISEMDKKCEEMMVSKFGCVVDIEKLETVTVNRNIEELKEKLRMTEIQCSEEVEEWNEKLSEKKNQITDLIRENTKRLNQLSDLMNNKHFSEGALNSRQKNLGEEYSGTRKADIRERQRLMQLVQLQAQEIDALKEEIMLLSRKGGHILPPAQPPCPRAHR